MKFCSKLFILLRNEKREELTNLDYEYRGHFDITARIIFRGHLTKLDFNNRREI